MVVGEGRAAPASPPRRERAGGSLFPPVTSLHAATVVISCDSVFPTGRGGGANTPTVQRGREPCALRGALPRSRCKPEVEPAGFSLGRRLGWRHRLTLSCPWVLAGRAAGLGQRGRFSCCLRYLEVIVTQSPTDVMHPGQGEALNQGCCISTLSPAAGRWGRDGAGSHVYLRH